MCLCCRKWQRCVWDWQFHREHHHAETRHHVRHHHSDSAGKYRTISFSFILLFPLCFFLLFWFISILLFFPPVTGRSGGERTPVCHHLSLNSCFCEEWAQTTVSLASVWRHRHRNRHDGKEQKWHGPTSANLSHRCRLWRGKVLAKGFLSLGRYQLSVFTGQCEITLWFHHFDIPLLMLCTKTLIFFHVRWTLQICEVAAVISVYFFFTKEGNPNITYSVIGNDGFALNNGYLFMATQVADGTYSLQVRSNFEENNLNNFSSYVPYSWTKIEY